MFIEVNCSHCDKIYDAEVQGTDYELKQLGSKFGSCPSCKDKGNDNDNPYGALMGHKADSIIKIVDEASFVTKSSEYLSSTSSPGPLPPGSAARWITQDKAKELYPPQCRHENWKDVDSDRKRECLDCPMVMNVSTGGNHLFEWRTPGKDQPFDPSKVLTASVMQEAREALLKNGQVEAALQIKDQPLRNDNGLTMEQLKQAREYLTKPTLGDMDYIFPIVPLIKDPKNMDLEEYGAYLKETKEKDLTGQPEVGQWQGVKIIETDQDEDDEEDEDCDHQRLDRTPTTGTFTCLDCDLRIDEGHEGYMQAFKTYFDYTKEVPHGHMDSPYRREDLDGSSRPYPGGSRPTDPPDSANPPRHKYSRMDLVQMLDHLRSNGMEYYHIPCKLPAQAVIQPSLRLMAECNHANWMEFDFGHSRKCQDCGNEVKMNLTKPKLGDQIQIGLRGNLIGGKVESNEHIKIESKVKLDPKSENMKFNLAQLVMKQHAKDSEAMARDMDAAVVKGLMETK